MRIAKKEIWLEMYKAAERVRDLKAWKWMEEDDLFAVVNPFNPEEIGFCSMMGSEGHFTALAIYKGWEGYDSYVHLRNYDGVEDRVYMVNVGFLQSCWMVEFTNAADMQRPSKNQLKELGIKYTGKGNWIDITDRKPGLLPWYVSEEDVPFITTCINQFFEVALRAEEDPSFLHQPNPHYQAAVLSEDDVDEDFDDSLLIFRKAEQKTDGKWNWYDEPTNISDITDVAEAVGRITPSIAAASLRKKLTKKETCLMIGMMVIPAPIQENEEDAPYLTFLMVFMLYGQKKVLRQELYKYEEIRGDFERVLLEVFDSLGYIPSQVLVNMDTTATWLDAYAELCDFDIFVDPEDENFEDCFGEFSRYFQDFS